MRALSPLFLCFWLASTPAQAQSSPELRLPENLDETLREMMEELKPALKQMFEFMESFEGVDDPRHYMLPEVMPNGDIIIRRRPNAPPFRPRDPLDDLPRDGSTRT